jgi:hypothetical protein
MIEQLFKKCIALDAFPREWELGEVAVDWSGLPLLLMVEGRGPRPDSAASREIWSHWYWKPPTALHIVFMEGGAVKTTRITAGIGELAREIQPFENGWILGYSRTGRAHVYDAAGGLMRTLNLGDAIEDLQTLPDGRIWVSYFDEGVYGEGISTQGLVCFDASGAPVFRYRDDVAQHKLPPIDDCYALNVAMNGDVWVNYYSDFPLVLLRGLEVKQSWLEFGSLGNAFAVRGSRLIYLRDSKLMTRGFESETVPEEVRCVDIDGNLIVPSPTRYLSGAARGSNLVLNTGTAIYVAEL